MGESGCVNEGVEGRWSGGGGGGTNLRKRGC